MHLDQQPRTRVDVTLLTRPNRELVGHRGPVFAAEVGKPNSLERVMPESSQEHSPLAARKLQMSELAVLGVADSTRTTLQLGDLDTVRTAGLAVGGLAEAGVGNRAHLGS